MYLGSFITTLDLQLRAMIAATLSETLSLRDGCREKIFAKIFWAVYSILRAA